MHGRNLNITFWWCLVMSEGLGIQIQDQWNTMITTHKGPESIRNYPRLKGLRMLFHIS